MTTDSIVSARELRLVRPGAGPTASVSIGSLPTFPIGQIASGAYWPAPMIPSAPPTQRVLATVPGGDTKMTISGIRSFPTSTPLSACLITRPGFPGATYVGPPSRIALRPFFGDVPGEPEIVGLHTERTSPPWLARVVQRLQRILALPAGWNGYRAPQVNARDAIDALWFLYRVMRPRSAPPSVVPLNDGGVQLEWHRAGLDVEVTFSRGSDRGLYWADHVSGEEFEGTLDAGVNTLRRLMDRFEEANPATTHATA